MLRKIVENGSPAQRERALDSLALSAQMRGERMAMGETAEYVSRALGSSVKTRIVYDAKNGSSLPGTQVRTEGAPATGDLAVDEAYDGSGATYDLFYDIYERNSIDAQGMRLDSTVHYQKGYDNAFWNGKQMVYGDGDEDLPESQRLFNRFTSAIDIIGHELTHGVTQFEAGLAYYGQSGALNESFSDVFGSLVKQRVLSQPATAADWIIGGGLLTANVNGVGIRSMKAPGTAYDDPVLGKDPQPAHMRDYQDVSYDNGGVHINSGIPNHAFYIAAVEMGGFAWNKAGRIWYVTLKDKLQSNANFQTAANQTHLAAGELYGANSLEQKAVQKGWEAVGISIDGAPGGGGSGTGCLAAPASVIRAIVESTSAMFRRR
jgi:Zn-dependent metalloprotease